LSCSDPVALQTALSILFLVARNAHNFLVTWDETLDSDWLQAGLAGKALLVPLLASVFVLLHTYISSRIIITTYIRTLISKTNLTASGYGEMAPLGVRSALGDIIRRG